MQKKNLHNNAVFTFCQPGDLTRRAKHDIWERKNNPSHGRHIELKVRVLDLNLLVEFDVNLTSNSSKDMLF